MSETKTTYLLWSMLTGTISFFASAVITSMVLLPLDFAIIDTILAGGIGGAFPWPLSYESSQDSKNGARRSRCSTNWLLGCFYSGGRSGFVVFCVQC